MKKLVFNRKIRLSVFPLTWLNVLVATSHGKVLELAYMLCSTHTHTHTRIYSVPGLSSCHYLMSLKGVSKESVLRLLCPLICAGMEAVSVPYPTGTDSPPSSGLQLQGSVLFSKESSPACSTSLIVLQCGRVDVTGLRLPVNATRQEAQGSWSDYLICWS